MKTANVQYFPKTRKVKIDAYSTDFYPAYLKYLFEYMHISPKSTIVFKDKTIKGIDSWIQEYETSQKFKKGEH